MKNKVIFMFLFLILIFFIMTPFSLSFVFADEEKEHIIDVPEIEIPEGYFYYLVRGIPNSGYAYELIVSDKEIQRDKMSFNYYMRYAIRNDNSFVFSVKYPEGVQNLSPSRPWHSLKYPQHTVGECLLSNYDILDFTTGEVIFSANAKDDFDLELNVSNTESTTELPLQIYSQNFMENYLKYEVYCSYEDMDHFKLVDIRSLTMSDKTYYQFYVDVYKNGTYYFKMIKRETGEEKIFSVTLNNIVYTQENVNNYINGEFRPTPFLNYEYIDENNILLTTQKFYEEEILKVNCLWAKDLTTDTLHDENRWNESNVRCYQDENGNFYYQFYLEVNNEDLTGDGTYFCKFYLPEFETESYATFTLEFDKLKAIIEEQIKINQQFDKFVTFFKDRFGFLTYPFELMSDIFTKMRKIKFEEPVIKIPEIKEPFTKVKLISATEFNFNNMLENEVLNDVHEIYLMVVDAIIAFGLAMFAKKKLEHVLNK